MFTEPFRRHWITFVGASAGALVGLLTAYAVTLHTEHKLLQEALATSQSLELRYNTIESKLDAARRSLVFDNAMIAAMSVDVSHAEKMLLLQKFIELRKYDDALEMHKAVDGVRDQLGVIQRVISEMIQRTGKPKERQDFLKTLESAKAMTESIAAVATTHEALDAASDAHFVIGRGFEVVGQSEDALMSFRNAKRYRIESSNTSPIPTVDPSAPVDPSKATASLRAFLWKGVMSVWLSMPLLFAALGAILLTAFKPVLERFGVWFTEQLKERKPTLLVLTPPPANQQTPCQPFSPPDDLEDSLL